MPIDLTYQPRFDCNQCHTPCDRYSKHAYFFENDLQIAKQAEDQLLAQLTLRLKLQGQHAPATIHGLPDLELIRWQRVIARIEVKVQGRAFMAVQQLLPQANLRPYETVVLNLSDLERYIALYQREHIPLFIIWKVKRPCIGEGYWGHHIEELKQIYTLYGQFRRYRRRSTPSDYVDGQHRGVTVNYHFSLLELLPLNDLEKHLATL